MSTFAELVNRVETTNTKLDSIRDTIESESIALYDGLADSFKDLAQPYVQTSSAASNSVDQLEQLENRREDKRLAEEQVSIFEAMANDINAIYQLLLGAEREDDKFKLPFDTAVPVPVGGRGPVVAGGVDKSKRGRGFIAGAKDTGKNIGGRALKIGLPALIANELLGFFGTSIEQLTSDAAKLIDEAEFKLSELTLDNIGQTLDSGIQGAIDAAFGDTGSTQQALEKGINGALVGGIIGGPWGALVGGALGLAAGYFKSEDAKQLYGRMKNIAEEAISDVSKFLEGAYKLATGDPEMMYKVRDAFMSNRPAETRSDQEVIDQEGSYALDPFALSEIGLGDTASVSAKNRYIRAREELLAELERVRLAGERRDASKKALENLIAMPTEEYESKYRTPKADMVNAFRRELYDRQVAFEDEVADTATFRSAEQGYKQEFLQSDNRDQSVNVSVIGPIKYESIPAK